MKGSLGDSLHYSKGSHSCETVLQQRMLGAQQSHRKTSCLCTLWEDVEIHVAVSAEALCQLPHLPPLPPSLAGLTELAQQPNVYCKVSGVFATDKSWTQQSVADVVQPILEIFGMDR